MNLTADRLIAAMEQRGLDQTDLAREVGATQGAISKIVQGKTANSRLIPKIAVVLGVPLGFLVGKTGDATDAGEVPLTSDERELVDLIQTLDPKNRAALIQIARALASGAQVQAQTLHAPRQQYRAA